MENKKFETENNPWSTAARINLRGQRSGPDMFIADLIKPFTSEVPFA